MTVTSRLTKLARVGARNPVLQDTFYRLYRGANALYEALFDASAPGGTQVYAGHDHTPLGGGGPIHRGGVWSEFRHNADAPLNTLAYTAANQTMDLLDGSTTREGKSFRYVTSPGLRVGARLRGWICTDCYGASEFSLIQPDGNEVVLPVSQQNSDGTYEERRLWTPFEAYVQDGRFAYETLALRVRCSGYDAEDPPVVKWWGITISETDASVGYSGAALTETAAGESADLVTSAFDDLDDALLPNYSWVDPVSTHRLYTFLSGLYEGVHDWRAPGAVSQVCRGHDHADYGGRLVARGRQYTAANGQNVLYTLSSWTSATWTDIDDDDTKDRTTAGIGMCRFRASPGMSSTGTPPSAAPYLTALILVDVSLSAASTVEFRFLRTGTAFSSASSSLGSTSSFSGWVVVDFIPCIDTGIDNFTLQTQVTGSGTGEISVYAIQMMEVPSQGGSESVGTEIVLGGGA
jgi:hypothetical protein